jgi:hypothetical protein
VQVQILRGARSNSMLSQRELQLPISIVDALFGLAESVSTIMQSSSWLFCTQ